MNQSGGGQSGGQSQGGQSQSQGGQNPTKYKTMLCRHFETTKGCMHKDKCQFAHGIEDLCSSSNVKLPK
jgi:hypothetical protein